MRRTATRAALVLAVAIAGAVVLLERGSDSQQPVALALEAGRVHLFTEGGSDFARWVHRSDCRRFLARYHRMRLFSPFADECVRGGYRGGLAYVNAQAIYPDEVRVRRRDSPARRRAKRLLARLILRDARGRRLYVPFRCRRGRCPQYAADIASPAWRVHILRKVGAALRKGYRGAFLDDVNWNLNTSDGDERPVAPVDRAGGRPLRLAAWRRGLARLVGAVRERHPRAELMINSVWWKREHSLANPDVARGVSAATHYNIERGTADTFKGQSFPALLATIDRLHALGLGVNLENYSARTRRQAEFELATYLLTSAGRDLVAAAYGSCPSARRPSPCRQRFWRGYRTDLGPPLDARRTRQGGLLERRFERGLVLLNPPGAPLLTTALAEPYTDIEGRPRTDATLSGGQAIILRRR